jgi:hypothetical protein
VTLADQQFVPSKNRHEDYHWQKRRILVESAVTPHKSETQLVRTFDSKISLYLHHRYIVQVAVQQFDLLLSAPCFPLPQRMVLLAGSLYQSESLQLQ